MNEPEYKCPNPDCKSTDVTFLRIDWKKEKVIFLCNCCGRIFEIEEQMGYIPKKVAALEIKYPPLKKKNVKKDIFL